MSKMKTLIEEYNKSKAELSAKIEKSFLKETLKEARSIEGLEGIRWQQYTPYFNDGEACEFGVHEPRFKLASTEESAGDYEDGYEDTWSIEYYTKEKKRPKVKNIEELKLLSVMIQQIPEEVMEALYGDHVEVTIDVKSGKVEVEEYSHD